MNEHGQWDKVIVPEKSPNEVGPNESTAEEQMEESTLTTGDDRQQSTLQTQGWESVHSALQLVHRRVKDDKKRQFTAITHHIDRIDVLTAAYLHV